MKKRYFTFIFLFLLLCAFLVLFVITPPKLSINESLLEKVPTTTHLVEGAKYTTITKDYSSGDDFIIMGFTDLHLDSHVDEGNNDAVNIMIENIKREQPDLVVFDGDIVTGYFNQIMTVQFAKIMEELGVYWCICLGNHEHDHFYDATRNEQINVFASFDHCLVSNKAKLKNGEKVWGSGNCVINIQGKDGKIIQSLYFLDCGKDMSEEDAQKYVTDDLPYANPQSHNKYDYVKDSQIEWYRETVQDINESCGYEVPNTVFLHTAVIELGEAWNEITGEGYVIENAYRDSEYQKAAYIYDKASGDRLLEGKRREDICHSAHNSGLFDACRESGCVAMLFGHDHINDFVLSYKDVLLGYIKASGYSIYNTLSVKYEKDGTQISVEDHLTTGYSLITVGYNGQVSVKGYENRDFFNENYLNEVMSRMRKK